MSQFLLDPDATLDFAFSWTAWLQDGETIVDHEIITEHVTVDSTSEQDGAVTVWLSKATPGWQTVTCRITTSQGRTDDRSISLHVRDR